MTPAAVTATVLGYIAVLFAVAWASGRRADNAGFFTGNRRTPWYMAAFAMIGAAMSGVTFISVPGSVAADSFSYMQMVAGFTVGQLIVAFVLIPTFYRLRVVSLYEYLDNRFGVKSHRTGAWFFFISKMLGAALRVYVVCAVMQLLVFSHYGFPFWGNALVTMFFVWLYTRQGGVKSLIWTDTLKTFCLVASLVLSIVFIMRGLGLSFADTAREVSASPMSRIFFFDDPASGRYFWKMFAAGIVLLVAMTGLDQDMMQKNLSCKSLKDAQKNMYTYGFAFTPVNFLFLSLGVLLLTLASQQQIELPALNDDILPMFCTSGILGHSILIFFTIGIIAAAFSSADSALTALTTSFCIDILGVEKEKAQSAKRTRLVVHLMISILFAIIILAFKAINNRSVIDAIYMIASYTYGPLLGLFVFGLFTKKHPRDKFVPYICIVSPLLCFLTDYLVKQHTGYAFGYEMLMLNGAITFGGLWLSSIGNGQLTIRKKSINT